MEQQDGTIAAEQPANKDFADSTPVSAKSKSNKPNRWLAVALAFVHPLLGMLYVVQPTAAALYLIVGNMLMQYVMADKHSPAMLAMVMTWGIRAVAAGHAFIMAVQYPEDKPRPWYSRGPFAVALNVVVLLLIVAANVALVKMAHGR